MKFLIDAQLPPALCDWLRARGYESVHVADLAMLGASDAELAAHAEVARLVIVSKDEDFLLLRLPDRFAFLWLRIGNATNRTLFGWLDTRWPAIENLLASGERVVEVR